MENFKEFIKEGKVTLSGASESVIKLKELHESLQSWLQAADTLEGTQSFMTTKAIKSAIVNLKKVAEAIDKADAMEKKYKETTK